MAQSGRTYSAARFAIAIDGTPAGFAVSVSGGERFAEVLERPGTGGLVDKHLGPVQFEPIVLEIGAAPGPLLDWIRDALAGAAKPHSGAFPCSTTTIASASASSGRTACSSRSPSRPETPPTATGPASTSRSAPSRRDCSPVRTARSSSFASVGSKQLRPQQLPIRGLRARVGMPEDPNRLGGHLPAARRPRRRRCGSSGRWRSRRAWSTTSRSPCPRSTQRRSGRGSTTSASGVGTERTARLAFLTPSLKDDLLRIDLGGVGVCRVADVRHVSGSQAIASSEVTMYCESAALAPAPQTTAPQPDAASRVAGDRHRRPGPPRRPPGRRHRRAHADHRELTAIDRRPAARHADHRADRSRRRHRTGSLARSGLGERRRRARRARRRRRPCRRRRLDRPGPRRRRLAGRVPHRARVLDPAVPTPGELDRDDLVAGLVAGAAEVHAAVTPLLAARRADAAPAPSTT